MNYKYFGNILLFFIPFGIFFIFFKQEPLKDSNSFMMMVSVITMMFYGLFYIDQVKPKFWQMFAIALISRLIFLFISPSLSPDYYRFIWDGELLNMGINPYAFTPDELISLPSIYDSQYMRMIYHGMTDLSKVHYSNYPVFNQFFYYVPAYFSDSIQGNVLGYRIVIILADIGSIFLLKNLLSIFKQSEYKLWLYALNPLIIIEFAGNLHFEGVMIFFLLLAIYFIINPKFNSSGWILGAFFLALSAQLKLIPLMFIPFFYKKLGWRKSIGFTAATFLVFLLIGLVLWNDNSYINNMMTSINDYFVSFEFNSSIFSIVNHFKSEQLGWNATYIVGPMLSKIALVLIVLLAIVRNYRSDVDIIKGMMFALLIYYSFSTTVHPWYISMILVLSVFTNYRFAFVWSLAVFMSYGIYVYSDNEKMQILAVITEYTFVLIALIRDIIINRRKDVFGLNFNDFFMK